MELCVPALHGSNDGNDVCSFPVNPFQVVVYLQCLLNEPKIRLQFLTSAVLIGRSRWMSYQKFLRTLWFFQWLMYPREFCVGKRSKKIP